MANGKSDEFENDLLRLIFANTGISRIGDTTGIPGSSAAGSLYFSLHTADPEAGGDQTSNEVNTTQYQGYARVGVTRAGGSWTISAAGSATNTVSPVSAVTFANSGAGSTGVTITHAAIGTDASGSSGKILYSGALSANIVIPAAGGVTPQLLNTSSISEE